MYGFGVEFPVGLVNLSICLSSIYANYINGRWRELENLTSPHEAHHSSRFMRTCHTHFGVPSTGIVPAGGMTKKDIISMCCLSSFAWIFPTILAVHFFALAFLVITFWSKECVIIGIEGLMSSGSVTNVTGTCFRMRNTILLNCPHEHLVSLRTQHRQLVFPPQYEDSTTCLMTFVNHPGISGVAYFVVECLALFP